MYQIGINAVEPAEGFVISAQNNFVSSRKLNADAIIRERTLRVEVEDENVTVPLKAYDFVALVTPRHVTGIAEQPSVLRFRQIHDAVEFVQKFVLQCVVVCEMENFLS